MANEDNRPLSKIEKCNRAFAIIWLLLQVFFCFMYGFYVRPASISMYYTNGLQ